MTTPPSAAHNSVLSPYPERLLMVMLVDDQPFVAEIIRRQLISEHDINFHYCINPAEAISTAEKIGPTVVLLDLVMPDIDGLMLCRLFRNHPTVRDLPVVMLSSTEDPAVKAQAFAAGANDYLVKPPEKLELIARLRYHSASYINKLQRDEAYRALRASQIRLEELNMELLQLANLDGLTGLANRRYFNERYHEEWARAVRGKKPIALLMLDVDRFKTFNDHYGHLGGDDCLKQIAAAIKNMMARPGDIVARYGGEEFIVALPDTSLDSAAYLAEKIRVEVEKQAIPHELSDISPYVTVSLGVAEMIPSPETDPNTLIKQADQCLYQAKHLGRNQVQAVMLATDPIDPAEQDRLLKPA